ncbi:MAG: AhpC/TSA family protein [Deltaproteobacteria bacterium]|nr:AhpC/TSA family protein [Deltaproteobacteria bacterium]
MHCRELATQVRPLIPELTKNGAKVAVIGVGAPYFAKAFDDEVGLAAAGAQLLTDPTRAAHEAAGMKRGVWNVVSPAGWGASLKTIANGHRNKLPQGDPWQQGGALVVRKGGEITFEHHDPTPGEQVDLAKLLEATLAAS